MMFLKKPDWFREDLRVSGCIIEAEWDILLLQQWTHKKDAWKWLEAWGKVHAWENHEEAIIREVFEETWIIIKLWEAQKLFRRYFYYHSMHITLEMYFIKYNTKPEILMSEEHSKYVWVSPYKSLSLDLVEDLDTIIQEIYKI